MSDETPVDDAAGRQRRAGGSQGRIWGIILILVGAWFFIERTLRIDLPAIPWNDLWPVALIGIGAWIVIRGAMRRST